MFRSINRLFVLLTIISITSPLIAGGNASLLNRMAQEERERRAAQQATTAASIHAHSAVASNGSASQAQTQQSNVNNQRIPSWIPAATVSAGAFVLIRTMLRR